MLNDAAKKLIARAARADISPYRDRLQRGADADRLCAEAWQTAHAQHPEFREWTGAEAYFEAVFLGEIED